MTMTVRIIATLLAGVVYWFALARIAGVSEPWDAGGFWYLWCPLALALSAAAGFVLGRKGWLVVVAQWPVMGPGGGGDDMWVAGLVVTVLLALPAMAVSALAGRMGRRSAHAG